MITTGIKHSDYIRPFRINYDLLLQVIEAKSLQDNHSDELDLRGLKKFNPKQQHNNETAK